MTAAISDSWAMLPNMPIVYVRDMYVAIKPMKEEKITNREIGEKLGGKKWVTGLKSPFLDIVDLSAQAASLLPIYYGEMRE